MMATTGAATAIGIATGTAHSERDGGLTRIQRVHGSSEVGTNNDIHEETHPDHDDHDITPPVPPLINVEPNPGPGQTELTPSSIDPSHSSTSTNSAGGSSSPGRDLTSTLSMSLLGHCFVFLQLNELHAVHSVSQFFRQASEHESSWNEGEMLVVTGQLTISSPRTRLQFPSNKLVSLRTSSFGRSMRWLEMDLTSAELKDVQPLVDCHPHMRLHGLIITNLTRVEYRPWLTSIIDQTTIWDQLNSFSLTSSLCVLSIGRISSSLLVRLLPIISSIRTLTTLELELQATSGELYTIPTTFATHLSKLVSLQRLILSNQNYRENVRGFDYDHSDNRDVYVSNSCLVPFARLLHALPQLKLELYVFLACATVDEEFNKLEPCVDPATFALPRVTTLVVHLYIALHYRLPNLYSYFPDLVHVIDLSRQTGGEFFKFLPSTVEELTMSNLHGFVHMNSDDDNDALIVQYSLRRPIRRFTFGYFSMEEPFEESRTLFESIFGALEELSRFQLTHSSSDGAAMSDALRLLYPSMKNLNIGVFHWTELQETTQWSEQEGLLLATHFPAVTKLHVIQSGKARYACAYEARETLRMIPHLKEVKWNDEPWLPLDQIESYYSWENISKRSGTIGRLDTIEPIPTILQQITAASLPTSPPFTLNILSLTLIFQFLSLQDLFSAHRVCRSYRVAAVSPLVLRPNIHFHMDRFKGAVVSGTKVSFSSIAPMKTAVRSMLIQNIRILTLPLPLASSLKPNPRQPGLYHWHLNRFELIPYFHSLHTLSLDWSVAPDPLTLPSGSDEELIERVLQSSALKHLKLLRLLMPPRLLEWILPKAIHSLSELEAIELRSCVLPLSLKPSESQVNPFLPLRFCHLWSHLKHFCLIRDQRQFQDRTTPEDLEELLQLFQLMNPPLESIAWGPVIDKDLIQELAQRPINQLPILPPMHSINLALSEGMDGIVLFDTLMRVFPELHHLQLLPSTATVVTFPTRLSIQLESLTIRPQSVPTTLLLMEAISQCAKGVPDGWKKLKQFRLEKSENLYAKVGFLPTDQLAPFLQAATNLTDLTLEGVQFALDLEPQPWIARLRRFQHSDQAQVNRLLPLATNLVEFHTSNPSTLSSNAAASFFTLLLAHPQPELYVFNGQPSSRKQLEESHRAWCERQEFERKLKEAPAEPIQHLGFGFGRLAPPPSSSSFTQPMTADSFAHAFQTMEEAEVESDLDDTHLTDIFQNLITSLHTPLTTSAKEPFATQLPFPPLKCWLTAQSVINLALICRYLTSAELLAVDKTCRQLSAAASHLVTFQQEEPTIGVTVDLYQCSSYAHGPSVAFSWPLDNMRRAFQSRLFKHYQIVYLKTSAPTEPVWFPDTMAGWLTCLMESVTPLRALTMQLTDSVSVSSSALTSAPFSGEVQAKVETILTRFSADKSMANLTLLHLDVGVWLRILLPHLPPSLLILHLTLPDNDNRVQSLIDGILSSPAANSIRTYIFDPSDSCDPGADTSLADLQQLARLSSAQAEVEAIEWRFPIDLIGLMRDFRSNLNQSTGAFPRMPKLHTVLINFIWSVFEQEATYNYLDVFPDLKRLIILHSPLFSQSFKQHLWAHCTEFVEIRCVNTIDSSPYEQNQLTLMKADSVLAAPLSQLRTLVVDDLTLTDLLPTLPNLTSIHCHRLENIIQLDSSNLDTGITYLQRALPSLTELRLELSPLVTPYFSPLLHSIPQLKRIRWSPVDWMDLHKAIIELIQDEATATYQARQRSEQPQPTTPFQLESLAVGEAIINRLSSTSTAPNSSLFKSKTPQKKGKR